MNNNFFTLCETNDNKIDTYNCCLKTCLNNSTYPKICYSMCSQIFPFIKEECAFEMDCWNNEQYDNFCMRQKNDEIHKCCLRKCNNLSFNKYPDLLDCDLYCSDYEIMSTNFITKTPK